MCLGQGSLVRLIHLRAGSEYNVFPFFDSLQLKSPISSAYLNYVERSKGFEKGRSVLNYVEIIDGFGPFSEGLLCDSKRNENGHISKYFTNFFELAHLLPYDAHVPLPSDVHSIVLLKAI